jgi:hypothetical protein
VVVGLLRGLEQMWPEWRDLKWWTFRRGELRRLNGTRMARRLDPRAVEDRKWRIPGEVRSWGNMGRE